MQLLSLEESADNIPAELLLVAKKYSFQQGQTQGGGQGGGHGDGGGIP